MRIFTVIAASALVLTSVQVQAQDEDRTVKGGITAAGWQGRVDARPASQGKTINDSRFYMEGKAYRLEIGPAGTYWNPSMTASGNYTVSAKFKEHAMAASHPHSYGVFIGGSKLDSDATQRYMYCIAYGTGKFSIKHFNGQKVTTVVNMQDSDALNKADGAGAAMNELGWMVSGDKVSCMANGKAIHTLNKADVVGADKLDSTDGVYGFRVSHNLNLTVSDLTKK